MHPWTPALNTASMVAPNSSAGKRLSPVERAGICGVGTDVQRRYDPRCHPNGDLSAYVPDPSRGRRSMA